ncbi:MAG: WG repeat-containing protein [Planctomycetota bacterium]
MTDNRRRQLRTAVITIAILSVATVFLLEWRQQHTWPPPELAELYPVRVGDKWGFIDPQGNTVIPPAYDFAGDFRHGLGLVEFDGKAGYLNRDGSFAISPRFALQDAGDTAARSFWNGLAAARSPDGKWGFIDTQGQWVIPPTYTAEDGQPAVGDFAEGLAWFVDDNGKFGYLDTDGDVVITPVHTHAGDFGQALAPVRATYKWGFINRDGKRVIPARWDGVGRFSEGLCAVEDDGLWGYINRDGEMVIEPQFRGARDFFEGLAPAADANGRWGYINPQGEWAIAPAYRSAAPFENGIARVTTDPPPPAIGQEQPPAPMRYIDPTGRTVWPKD